MSDLHSHLIAVNVTGIIRNLTRLEDEKCTCPGYIAEITEEYINQICRALKVAKLDAVENPDFIDHAHNTCMDLVLSVSTRDDARLIRTLEMVQGFCNKMRAK